MTKHTYAGNRTLMKRCRDKLVGCQNTVLQQEHIEQSRFAAAAGVEGGSGMVAGAEESGQCSSTLCLDGFVDCMRISACPDKGPSAR